MCGEGGTISSHHDILLRQGSAFHVIEGTIRPGTVGIIFHICNQVPEASEEVRVDGHEEEQLRKPEDTMHHALQALLRAGVAGCGAALQESEDPSKTQNAKESGHHGDLRIVHAECERKRYHSNDVDSEPGPEVSFGCPSQMSHPSTSLLIKVCDEEAKK